MIAPLRLTATQRLFLIALPLAICLALAFPAGANAHAILLRSDPAQDAILQVAPQLVRMWFSEDLNPALSTATVVNGKNTVVDNRDAHLSPTDPREMDITLQPHLAPAVYSVIWHSGSADDGHVLSGSFIFSIARPDGTVPTLNMDTNLGTKGLAGGNVTDMYMAQIDGPTLFNLIIITLVELAAVFWVGAQFWLIFVLRRASKNHKEQGEINRQVQQHFEQRLSLPTLVVLLLANTGVLAGQVLMLQGGQWGTVGTPFIAALIGVLICVGLMNVFAGTLSPVVVPQQHNQQFQATSRPFDAMARTSDNKFTAMLKVNPNHLGTNVFTVSVIDNSTGKPATDVGISLYTTALDMDMGTNTVNLLPDRKGHFSSSGDLSRAGNWRIRIQIRTPDNTLHEAIITLFTSMAVASTATTIIHVAPVGCV